MAVPSMVGRSKILKLFMLSFFIRKMRKPISTLSFAMSTKRDYLCEAFNKGPVSTKMSTHGGCLGDTAKEGGPENHTSEGISASLPNENVLLESPSLEQIDNLNSGK